MIVTTSSRGSRSSVLVEELTHALDVVDCGTTMIDLTTGSDPRIMRFGYSDYNAIGVPCTHASGRVVVRVGPETAVDVAFGRSCTIIAGDDDEKIFMHALRVAYMISGNNFTVNTNHSMIDKISKTIGVKSTRIGNEISWSLILDDILLLQKCFDEVIERFYDMVNSYELLDETIDIIKSSRDYGIAFGSFLIELPRWVYIDWIMQPSNAIHDFDEVNDQARCILEEAGYDVANPPMWPKNGTKWVCPSDFMIERLEYLSADSVKRTLKSKDIALAVMALHGSLANGGRVVVLGDDKGRPVLVKDFAPLMTDMPVTRLLRRLAGAV